MKNVTNILYLSEIVNNYDIFILDQWGVMHDGFLGYPKAITCVEKLIKAKKKLKWLCKSDVIETLDKTIESNSQVKKGNSAKNVCEKQFLMHIHNNK